MKRILRAAIKIKDKVYEASGHGRAIEKANLAGEDITKIDREKDGMFRTSDDRLLTRAEAKMEFGISRSEDIKEPKRKFILVTSDYSGIGFALQEIKKGGDVIIGFKNDHLEPDEKKNYLNIGKGLIKSYPLEKLMAKRNELKDAYWVFDFNCNPDENDLLRKEGFKVWGGHSITKKMEDDREYTLDLAAKYHLYSPPYQEFKSIADGVKFLQENEDKAYVFKANGADDCSLTRVPSPTIEPAHANKEMQATIQALGVNNFILQEKVEGVEINVEFFVVDGEPVLAQANLESKRLSNGDYGPNTGCMLDVCWIIPMDCNLAKMTAGKWLPLAKEMKFTGFVDANCIIGQEDVFFLETCWRAGYNSHPNFFQTISKKNFLQTCADMVDGIKLYDTFSGFGSSLMIRLDKPIADMNMYFPDSLEPNIHFFDVKKDKDLYLTAGYSKEIAIITGHDWTIERSFKDTLENSKKFRLDDKIQRLDAHRTDFPSSPILRYEALQAMGLI